MKFGCDKCHTRYSIADERVRGRVLKIRCKACNNVITVREEVAPSATDSMQDALNQFAGEDDHTRVSMPPQSAAAPAPASPAAPASKEEVGADDWFVSFDGEQEGPLPLSRALDRVRSERSRGKECFCWRAGFFVWLPVEEVSEFAPALAKAAPPPVPAGPSRVTGSQAAVRGTRSTGQQAAGKSPTGKQAAVRGLAAQEPNPPTGRKTAARATGQQPAVKSATGKEPAVKSATGKEPAVKSATGKEPAVRSATGKEPALKSPSGSMGAVAVPLAAEPAIGQSAATSAATSHPVASKQPPGAQPLFDLPAMDSGPLSLPESLMPSLVTRPEPRLNRHAGADERAAVPLPAVDSGPAVSPFLAALQVSGPTQVANDAPKHYPVPRTDAGVDSGPVPLPPPPGDDLPIGEASGLLNLSHLSKPTLAAPTPEASKRVVDTFGGVPVIPTPAAQPVVIARGAARGGPAWMKWAALGGAAATVSLLVVVVVLMARKPTVIVVPPAPQLDDGKKMADKPITVADPGPIPGAAPATGAAVDKRAPKRSVSSARAAGPVKPPPAEKDSLSSAQRNLASLYRDDTEHGPHDAPSLDRGGKGAGGQVSQQAIMGVVTQNRRSLNLCYDRVLKHDASLKSGRVVTHVKIGISGSVTGVSVPDPQYANSEIGQCITQTIKHWHFPSADSEYETEFPIILQAN